MMTGIHAPDGGDATIYGLNIKTDMPTIQQNLGLCQQFDVLFEDLTVSEHLDFVCEMKNMPL
jgi:ABC-type multidrug transport system ATPase subunit